MQDDKRDKSACTNCPVEFEEYLPRQCILQVESEKDDVYGVLFLPCEGKEVGFDRSPAQAKHQNQVWKGNTKVKQVILTIIWPRVVATTK